MKNNTEDSKIEFWFSNYHTMMQQIWDSECTINVNYF